MSTLSKEQVKALLTQQLRENVRESFAPEARKSDLYALMRNSVVELVFEKKDGSVRYMEATQAHALMSSAGRIESEAQFKRQRQNPNLLPAYDLELEDWRALRPSFVFMYRVPGELPVMTQQLRRLYKNFPDRALMVLDEGLEKMGQHVKAPQTPKREKVVESPSPSP